MKILISASATKLQLDKAKEIEKKAQKKVDQMTKALKELKAGLKAAKAVNKKGDGTAAQLKDISAAHKHVKAKPRAGKTETSRPSSRRPATVAGPSTAKKPSTNAAYKPGDNFITIVEGKEDKYSKTLNIARKHTPKKFSGKGEVFALTSSGRKGKKVLTWAAKDPVTRTVYKGYNWRFASQAVKDVYEDSGTATRAGSAPRLSRNKPTSSSGPVKKAAIKKATSSLKRLFKNKNLTEIGLRDTASAEQLIEWVQLHYGKSVAQLRKSLDPVSEFELFDQEDTKLTERQYAKAVSDLTTNLLDAIDLARKAKVTEREFVEGPLADATGYTPYD